MALRRMNWQDIPLKVINFISFWLNNEIKEKRISLEELGKFANDNKYSITHENIIQILEIMVASDLATFEATPKGKMLFSIDEARCENIVAQYKNANI